MNLLMRRIIPLLMLGLLALVIAAAVQPQPTGVLWDIANTSRVNTAAVTADGQMIAFGSSGNLMRVYDHAGEILWEFSPENSVLGMDITPDGQRTVVASEDRNVYMLDEGGQVLWQYRAQRSMNNAAIADDLSLIVGTSNDLSAYGLNAAGELQWRENFGVGVKAVDIYGTGDNARPVIGTDNSRVYVYSRSGQRLLEMRLDYGVLDVAVTSNGARIVAGTEDGSITLLHGGNGSVLWQVDAGSPVNSVAIQPGGELILAGTKSGKALLLDSEGKILETLMLDSGISDVALSGDGNVMAFATEDGESQVQDRQMAAATSQSQTAQRNMILSGGLGILVLGTASAGWFVHTTSSGQQIWQKRTAGPRRVLRLMWRARLSYLFILPTILLLAVFNYYPASSGLYHAFTDWNPGATTTFVGLDNFRYLFQDRFFWAGFGNAIILVIVGLLKIVTVPLLIAELIFHIRNARLKYIFRTLFVVPIVLPMVVQILVWNNIYEPTIGLLNQTLIALGLGNWTQVWYGDASVALLSVIFIGFPWADPFALLVFYGGLISISDEIFDAAQVDGASGLRRFLHIDFPLLTGQFRLLTILTFIAMAQTFELVFLTTGGGPGASTYTPALELYYMATRLDKLGVASAIGIVLFVIILAGTLISYRARREIA